MPHTLLAQIAQFVGHGIPLFLLTFGIMYLVLGFVIKPMGYGALVIPIAVLAVAAALAWFVVSGATFGGFVWIAPDVLAVVGVGIVLLVLGRVFAG
ncbi:TPA: hypothetical protein H1005_00645 [archaeon]|uniref:Uncharacterized protein n=1 Tax=Candidatus Naiadarchaeum limnaeum TaxID=2756139 RepID=A0A832V4D5_9ARCH|nr:hypothetical protein [Candidatus Naiadarchaeales archaeon SRR2090153.bin1042]HIK00717.1 hypothetical protein [Candidatus Naiadarchaeum limnaeum]